MKEKKKWQTIKKECDKKMKACNGLGLLECGRRRKLYSGLGQCLCNKENCYKYIKEQP